MKIKHLEPKASVFKGLLGYGERTFNQRVEGSSPSHPTNYLR